MLDFAAPRLERARVATRLMLIGGSVAVLAATVVAGRGVATAAGLTLIITALCARPDFLSRWDVMLGGIIIVILFVPIRRYAFPVNLPFDLEPYRVAVAIVVAFWITSALIDRSVTLRRTPLDAPLLLFGLAVLGSILTNFDRILGVGPEPIRAVIREFQPDIGFGVYGLTSGQYYLGDWVQTEVVLKKLVFLVSFYAIFYFVVSTVKSIANIHFVLKTLVAGGAILAAFAILEARTGYNVFNHLSRAVPVLRFEGALEEEGLARGGRLRVYASSQHPIALGAVLVMLTPLAFYLARLTGRRIWWGATALIFMAALGSLSRTAVIMFTIVFLVFLVLRPHELRPFLPLAIPLAVVIHFAVPGALGTLVTSFSPSGGLVEEQSVYGGRLSGERIGPQIEAIERQPLFGQGYGTRQTTGNQQNSRILDDEWLGTTVETGLMGLVAWLWLFGRFARLTGREAARDPTSRGLLLTALASSVMTFAVGMLVYDAFSFIQVTFVLFILAGIGMCVLTKRDTWPALEPFKIWRPPGSDPGALVAWQRDGSDEQHAPR